MKSLPNILARSAVLASLAVALATSAQAATVTWNGGDMTWSQPDSNSWTGATYQSGDIAQFLGAGVGTVTVDAGGVTPGSITVNSTTPANYTFSGGGIGGTGTIFTKSGNSILTLSGANTFTGNFDFKALKVGTTATYSGGTVRVGANGVGTAGEITSSPFGTGTVNMYCDVITNIALGISSDSTDPRTILNRILNSRANSKQVNMTLGDVTNNGKLTFAGDWDFSAAGNFYSLIVNSDVQINGKVSCGNNNYFIKHGLATLILTNSDNTPPSGGAGKISIGNGTLLATRAAALKSYLVTAEANKIIIGINTDTAVLAVQMGDGADSGWSTAQVDTLLNNATKTRGALGIDTTNADITQWAAFTTTNFGTALGLTKLGSHTLTLNQANTYAGKTTVSAGTLLATMPTALPNYTTLDKVVINGPTAVLGVRMGNGSDTGWSTAQVDTLLSNAVKTAGALGIDTTNASMNQWAAFTTTSFGSTLGLTKLGSNTLTLNQANTYAGKTTVSAGTLALVGGSQSSAITVNNGAALGFTLGSPTTSSQQVTLEAGHAIAITGTVDNSSDYKLMTASGFTGTPALAASISNYILETRSENTELWLAYSGSPASPYDTWADRTFANGTLADKSAGADGDSDGLTNLQEFAFGTDPTVNFTGPMVYVAEGNVTTAGQPVLLPEDGTYYAVFGRRKDHVAAGLTYTVQFSADLEPPWVASAAIPTRVTGESSSGDIEAMRVPFPGLIPTDSGPKKANFFRVEVSQTTP